MAPLPQIAERRAHPRVPAFGPLEETTARVRALGAEFLDLSPVTQDFSSGGLCFVGGGTAPEVGTMLSITLAPESDRLMRPIELTACCRWRRRAPPDRFWFFGVELVGVESNPWDQLEQLHSFGRLFFSACRRYLQTPDPADELFVRRLAIEALAAPADRCRERVPYRFVDAPCSGPRPSTSRRDTLTWDRRFNEIFEKGTLTLGAFRRLLRDEPAKSPKPLAQLVAGAALTAGMLIYHPGSEFRCPLIDVDIVPRAVRLGGLLLRRARLAVVQPVDGLLDALGDPDMQFLTLHREFSDHYESMLG